MVPDTVQLMVEVAGLCSSAPAFDVTRPAGIAPWRSAHRNDSYHCSRSSSAFHVRERARDPLVRVVHRPVDGRAVLRDQAIFLIPDVVRRFLERNTADIFGLYFDHRIHGYLNRSLIIMARHSKTSGGGPDEQGTPCAALETSGGLSRTQRPQHIVSGPKSKTSLRSSSRLFYVNFYQKKHLLFQLNYNILPRNFLITLCETPGQAGKTRNRKILCSTSYSQYVLLTLRIAGLQRSCSRARIEMHGGDPTDCGKRYLHSQHSLSIQEKHMTVVRYEPWSLVNRFHRDLDRLFCGAADDRRRLRRLAAAGRHTRGRTSNSCCTWICRASTRRAVEITSEQGVLTHSRPARGIAARGPRRLSPHRAHHRRVSAPLQLAGDGGCAEHQGEGRQRRARSHDSEARSSAAAAHHGGSRLRGSAARALTCKIAVEGSGRVGPRSSGPVFAVSSRCPAQSPI